jgi:tetratricopeptide (TPR) repeat protein
MPSRLQPKPRRRPGLNTSEKRLTVCMIVKDEEANLPRALRSVEDLADEIVVVDTGSTDGTKALAASMGATVFDHEWKSDFADAKNAALEKASGDWILFLDADECVCPGSADKIATAISGDADAYFVAIESDVRSGAGRTFVNLHQRLFRNNMGIRYEGAVHEQVDSSLRRAGAVVRHSGIVIRHAGYGMDDARMRLKLERNLDILNKVLAENPDDSISLFHLGETLSMLGTYDAAADAYERALEAGGLPAEIRPVANQNLASSMIKLCRYEEAMRLIRRVREMDPSMLSPHLLLGSALFGLKKFERAEKEILTYVSRAGEAERSTAHVLGFKADIPAALVLVAKCRLADGNLDGAREVLKDAVAMDPGLADSHMLLGRIAFETMDFARAVPHFERALEIVPGEERLYFELAKSYMAAGAYDRAEAALERAADKGIESAGLMRCLGIVRVKRQDFTRAIMALEVAHSLDPADREAPRMLAGLYQKLGDPEAAKKYLTICK